MGRSASVRFLHWCMRLSGQGSIRVRRRGPHMGLALRLAIGSALLLTASLLAVLAVVLLLLGR